MSEHIKIVTIPLQEYENLKAIEETFKSDYSIYIDHHFQAYRSRILTKDEAVLELSKQVERLTKLIKSQTEEISSLDVKRK